jgi:hypothetical protein
MSSTQRPKPIKKNLFASWQRGGLYTSCVAMRGLFDLEDTINIHIPLVTIHQLKMSEPKMYIGLVRQKKSEDSDAMQESQ